MLRGARLKLFDIRFSLKCLGAISLASVQMGLNGLAGRYASALLECAGETSLSVADDLCALARVVAESADLRQLFHAPHYGRADQEKALRAVLARFDLQQVTQNFVLLMCQNRRLAIFSDVVAVFLAELARRRGEVRAQVTAAQELTEAQKKSVAAALADRFGPGVVVESHVDEKLIGGLIVQVGSQMLDGSLRTKLQRLELAMKGVG